MVFTAAGVPAVAAVAESLFAGLPRLATLRLARCRLHSFPGLGHSHDATLRVLDVSANLIAEVRIASLHMWPHVLNGEEGKQEPSFSDCWLKRRPASLPL